MAGQQQEPEVHFQGNVDNVSLEQLSEALNWTPLSGTVSGNIPGVNYRNKTLSLGGELIIKYLTVKLKFPSWHHRACLPISRHCMASWKSTIWIWIS